MAISPENGNSLSSGLCSLGTTSLVACSPHLYSSSSFLQNQASARLWPRSPPHPRNIPVPSLSLLSLKAQVFVLSLTSSLDSPPQFGNWISVFTLGPSSVWKTCWCSSPSEQEALRCALIKNCQRPGAHLILVSSNSVNIAHYGVPKDP